MNHTTPEQVASSGDRLSRFRESHWYGYLRKNFGIFFFFLRFVKPHLSKMGAIFAMNILGTPIWFATAFLNMYLIDEVLLSPYKTVAEKTRSLAVVLTIQVLLWLIIRFYVSTKQILQWYIDLRTTVDIMRRFYRHEQSMQLAWHRKRAIGEHMYRTAEDVAQGQTLAWAGGPVSMITQDWIMIFDIIYQLIWATVLFSVIDPTLGIIALVYLLPWSLATQKVNGWWKRIEFQNREIQQERFAVERDVIAGLKTYKSLGRTRFVGNRFVQAMCYVQRMYYRKVVSWWVGRDLVLWIFNTLLRDRGIWLYVWVQVMLGRYTIGQVAVVMMVLNQLMKPFEDLVNLIQSFRQKLIPAERMMETFKAKPQIVDNPKAIRLRGVRGEIRFEGVSFGYDDSKPLLRDVNFTLSPGERIAFVGPSGAGKSTIFNLILRLYEPQGGRVIIDGHDIRDVRIKTYLDNIGVVMQETFLFSGTIRENVRYGNLLARDSEIERAIALADLNDFVAGSPDGLDTFLGEGTKISGGQKQRMGVARAVIREPSVFVMDEPTAHLDIVSETAVMDTIRNVTRGKTTLIISHRLAPIQWVDRLVVVTKDGVEAVGTHEELLEASPTYQSLWKEQQAGAAAA